MSRKDIFGRKDEQVLLKEILASKEAEFLAVYGRRRVGKTFLIRKYFSDKGHYFEITGQKDDSLQSQLNSFSLIYARVFPKGISLLKIPKSWKEAFEILTLQIESLPKSKKCILFFDELPWLSSNRSGFLQALDYYWNRHWSGLKNVVLIGCGSAASWMLDHLINARGGLYNRLTRVIKLDPFSIQCTSDYLHHRGFRLSPRQVCDIYMAIGGIPYYLKQLISGKSASQNINKICFSKDGVLFSEFERLFDSLFDQPDIYEKMIKKIASKRGGISREELLESMGRTSGGSLNKFLKALEAAGFIQSFIPYGNKKKNRYFRVIDEYTLFYLHWIKPLKDAGGSYGKSYWKTKMSTPSGEIWAGLAFEAICLKHIDTIIEALDLEGVHCEIGSWRHVPRKGSRQSGTQIDLLIDRSDGVITLCEIKYSHKQYTLSKSEAQNLVKKIDVFEEHFSTKKQIQLAMITMHGIRPNLYSEDLIDNEVVFSEWI